MSPRHVPTSLTSLNAESPPSPNLDHLALPGSKRTRHELAAHLRLSLRYIDELTRNGVLPFFRIGKSIRYDLVEVEAAMHERFHVSAKVRKLQSKGTRATEDKGGKMSHIVTSAKGGVL